MPDEDFLTVADVAEILRINQQTVRNWIDRGDLTAVKVGRRVRLRRTDLDAFVGSGTKVAQPTEPASNPPAIADGETVAALRQLAYAAIALAERLEREV